MSARVPVFRAFPREGIPPHYGTWEIYSHRVGQMMRAGAIEDYTYLWWDVRPHPKLGTVETRICDQQTSLESTLALAALIVSLAHRLSNLYDSEEPLVEYPTELIDDNKVRAAVRGMEGELVDFRAGRTVPASEFATRLARGACRSRSGARLRKPPRDRQRDPPRRNRGPATACGMGAAPPARGRGARAGDQRAGMTRMLDRSMAGPELSVVCRNCGSEVSPYVTECPYCGNRIRKRAPKLQREGDEIKIREGRREKKLRRDAERRARADERLESFGRVSARREELATRPWATALLLAIPALLFIATQASESFFIDVLDKTYAPEWPRFLIAPYFYESAGYLFVCGLALAIFLPPVERRIGSVPALILAFACGALSILGADGLNDLIGDETNFAAGANGMALGVIAAYVALREPERRADPEESYDPFAVMVCALVVLLIPLVQTFAEVGSGVVGAAVGAACGLIATAARRSSE